MILLFLLQNGCIRCSAGSTATACESEMENRGENSEWPPNN